MEDNLSFARLPVFPTEIWYKVFGKLCVKDLDEMHRCNRFFYKLISSDEFWNFFYKRRFIQQAQPIARLRYLQHYNILDWTLPCTELNPLLEIINKQYLRYDSQPPTLFQMLQIITYDSISYYNEITISDDIDRVTLAEINFNAILFFIRNYPNLLRQLAFKKLDIWQGNDLALIILATANRRHLQGNTKTTKHIAIAFINRYKKALANHLTLPSYIIKTTDRTETFTATGFRRLIYEGAHIALRMLFEKIGTAPFIPEITHIDEIDFCILSEITAAEKNRGKRDVKTLDVLFEHFSPQLRQLVQMHIFEKGPPNSFWALSLTTNASFVRRFLTYFKNEGQTFVEHFADEMEENVSSSKLEYEFQKIYAFVKAWCYN